MKEMTATLAKLPASERERFLISVEEAAHAAWAVLSGGQITECWAKADEGAVNWDGARTAQEETEISYAGFYTFARVEYGRIPTWERIQDAWRNASDNDRSMFAVDGGGHASFPRHIESDIEHLLPHIGVLAAQLYACGTATHADVESALGVTADRSLPLVKSLIRMRTLPLPDRKVAMAKVSR